MSDKQGDMMINRDFDMNKFGGETTYSIGIKEEPEKKMDKPDSAKAVAEVSNLIASAGDDESVLIYPEGTRFTQKKHDELRAKYANLAPQLDRWPNLLPVRLGGVTGMMAANPGKDLVFLAHAGFEGSADIHDLLNGGWLNQRVRLHFWRIPYADLPKEDVQEFLFREWDTMQSTVTALLDEIRSAA